jgi:lipoyl(octanoyl) transferase
VNRGGPIFFHCPGQLVVYPILKLSGDSYIYHDYIGLLERVIIQALGCLNVRAFRQQGQPGILVFSGESPPTDIHGQADSSVAKIGAIGVRVDRENITNHGFWINVNPSLQYFDLIVPGGIKDRYITSLQRILNKPIEIGTVIEPVIQSFCEVFEKKSSSFGGIGYNKPSSGLSCADMGLDDKFDRSKEHNGRERSTQTQT